MPTIKDIAQKTGLSVSTVSVVLRGEARRFGIREETEQRIREAAAELGYVRDDCARTMASGKSRVLGFIAGNRLQMEYAGRLLAGALTGATKLNYSLRFFLYDNNFKPEQLIMDLQAQKIRGILLSGDLGHHRIDPLIRQCTNYGIQCGTVNISNRVSGIGVASDDSSGMEEMVRRLYALGHRKISYQTVDTEAEYARKREKGYLAGIRANQAHYHVEAGGFAGAIGSEKSYHLSGADADRNIVDHGSAVIGFDQMLGVHQQIVVVVFVHYIKKSFRNFHTLSGFPGVPEYYYTPENHTFKWIFKLF